MNTILIICGPTGTGKTKLALSLAKKFNGELVSADSRQVYRGFDALTGKDRSKEIPIWLYDVIDVGQLFSAAHFVRLARRAVKNIHGRKKLPVVVGGTGLYLSALTTTIDTLGIPPNTKLRKRLIPMSVEKLQKELQKVDAARWKRMNNSDRSNPRRLIRAIEVSGNTSTQRTPKYDVLWIGLTASLPVLKQSIEARVKARWDKALGEVTDDLPPILGAGPLLLFLRGEVTKEEALRKWITAEYQYAKRQLVWFRKQSQILWLNEAQVEEQVRQWYT